LGANAGGAVEAMIFDFGNVLIGWDPENLYRKLIPDAAVRKHMRAAPGKRRSPSESPCTRIAPITSAPIGIASPRC
jgi:hypothetical protein